MTSNWLERNKILIRCGKYLTKKSIWENKHLSWIMKPGVYSKTVWNKQRYLFTITEPCLNHEFPRWELKNYNAQKICVSDMEAHAKKCVERYCELANRTTQQVYKVSTPCIDDHNFKEEEELKSMGDLSKVCSRIVLKCLFLARIGRPDILWSVNKLARSITKWTKACDKRLNRLISYIHHTCDSKQFWYVGSTAKQWSLGLFQDSDFAGDLEDSKYTSGGALCAVWKLYTVFQYSWMCKKQTSVSHSSTESEIISLDARLRLDGIPVLDLWDLIVAVLYRNTNQSNQARWDLCTNQREVRSTPHRNQTKTISRSDPRFGECWFYPLKRQPFVVKKLCCMCLKTTKQWSRWLQREEVPTVRHVSRNHRVALDWLFDRINLDPKIQIKYIDTKNQLTDHTDQGKFQTWWMESSLVFVQHHPFQFHQ